MSDMLRVPARNEVAVTDTWDLDTLYPNDQAWQADLAVFEKKVEGYTAFRGTLAESPKRLAECFVFDSAVDRLSERLGTYAFLKTTEDQSNNTYQAMLARFQSVSVNASQLASFIRPEILEMPADKLKAAMDAPELAEYRLVLERIARYKPHTLTQGEEQLLAMQGEMAQTANRVFRQLNDSDLRFGSVVNEDGQSSELTNSTFIGFLHSPNREVRAAAFKQYYTEFREHENTLSATLAGSIHGDVYYAKARRYPSALEAALFPDNVPTTVYDNLVSTVRRHLPAVYRYLDLRKRLMGLDSIHHYDTYVPILTKQQSEHSWDEAVSIVMDSLKPLGADYCQVLGSGLRGRWCDRYPNKNKQSGAFSCGSFEGAPYIMMNFKQKVLDDIFTLTHEAGHSMHSYHSAKHQPFQYYNYTIFVAEVASTFNEQLLAHHMIKHASSDDERAFLINHEIDSIRATIVRQTMFAEFERLTHAMAEQGEPLTVESFKRTYRELLNAYFGPDFVVDEELELECFRIPHFYRAFYVYKYATGLSAAIALSRRVLEGGASELADYKRFLSSGCSKDPLDLLRDAGVDMEKPEPIDTALIHFGNLVDELDRLMK
jgi:oligoendopeptidase F